MKSPEKRMWITKEQLGGLPQSIIDLARAEAADALKAEGKPDDGSLYLITTYFPSYGPFMKYSTERGLREKMYRIYTKRGMGEKYDNRQILKDIANIRLEIAKLMGKKNFAEYKLQETMAGNPGNVYKMLEDLRSNYSEPLQKELQEITEFARQTEGPDFKLMPWDYSYWSDKLKNARYSFNDEDMRPYFELNNTINGILGLATKLYGYTLHHRFRTVHGSIRAKPRHTPVDDSSRRQRSALDSDDAGRSRADSSLRRRADDGDASVCYRYSARPRRQGVGNRRRRRRQLGTRRLLQPAGHTHRPPGKRRNRHTPSGQPHDEGSRTLTLASHAYQKNVCPGDLTASGALPL